MGLKRLAIATLFALVLAATAACTPNELEMLARLTPAQRAELTASSSARTSCVEAMHQVWPRQYWDWATRIMWRESRHTPTARNSSGASGCWQLMLPLHNGRFTAVGCSPQRWSDALCNNLAAYSLFATTGPSPWKL